MGGGGRAGGERGRPIHLRVGRRLLCVVPARIVVQPQEAVEGEELREEEPADEEEDERGEGEAPPLELMKAACLCPNHSGGRGHQPGREGEEQKLLEGGEDENGR